MILAQLKQYLLRSGTDFAEGSRPFGVQLDGSDDTLVEPDIFIYKDKSSVLKDIAVGAPDFIAEIVSEKSRSLDTRLKYYKYKKSGVREYWIIDPKTEYTNVYK